MLLYAVCILAVIDDKGLKVDKLQPVFKIVRLIYEYMIKYIVCVTDARQCLAFPLR